MASTSKYLAQSNKSLRRDQATRSREAIPAARRNFVRGPSWPTAQRHRLFHDGVIVRIKFEATDATGNVHKRSSASHVYSHCLVIHFAAHPPSKLSPRASRPAATPNGRQAMRWPNAMPAAGAKIRMSRPSRSSRRGKCDAVPEGQEPQAGNASTARLT